MKDGSEIQQMLDKIRRERDAMPPAKREKLERRERQAQRESWVRAMAPCEHGIIDWENCVQCREPKP